MDQDIKLIIKEEISLLLTAGDKIVTKKTKKLAWWRVSYVKVIKGDYLSEKEIRLLLYNSFLKSSMSGKALRSRSGMSLDAW